jgi:raffinose/stachyose/melibiose transport system substrate-binding protein
MKLSRTAVALTAAAVLAALSACANPNIAGGQAGAETLSISSTSNEKPGLDALVAEYKKTHPGLDIQVTTAGTDQYQTTVRTQLSAGTGPDVLFVWPGNGNPAALEVLHGAGYLEDLTSLGFADQVPETIRSVTQIDGKAYVAPITFSGIGAIYNTEAVQAAGLTPPTTWSELLRFCGDAQARGVRAFALGAQTPWVTQLVNYSLTPTLVYGPEPDFAQRMAAGQQTFVGSPWETAMQKYLAMNEAGCFNDNPLGTNYEASITSTARGQTLAVVQVNSAVTQLKMQAPDTTFTMLPVPATDNPDETRMAGAAGANYGVNAASEHKEQAIDFVKFMISPEGMRIFTAAVAALPAIPYDGITPDPSLAALQDYQKAGKTDPYMDQLWPNARVQQTHFAVVQDLLSGNVTIPEGLQRMDDAYKQGA